MEKKETFSKLVKEEIAKNTYDREELLALLSGFIKVNGVLSFNENEKTLVLRTENNQVAKLIYNSLKELLGINMSFKYSRKVKLNKNVVYYLFIKDKIDEILEVLELRQGVFSTYPKNLTVGKKLRFFIAGAFLASGSVNSPESQNYHLQIAINEEEDAKHFLKLLNRFHDNKMDFKLLKGKKKQILYLKKADHISTFLSIVNAENCMFKFENVRIEKDFINSENRLNICMIANYQRTRKKALSQIEDITFIKNNSDLALLPIKERALCELRIDNPEASLSQLSEMLLSKYNLSVSKSGVNHLFDAIHNFRLELEKKINQ